MKTEITKTLMKLYEKWQAVQPLPEVNKQSLWQWIRLKFNHQSNHFEGNTLTYSETQLLLIHGETTGDHTLREYEEMKAHNTAFKYMCDLSKDGNIITEKHIRDLNKILLKEPFYKKAVTPDRQETRKKIIPGQYKTQANHVITQTGDIFHFAEPLETPAKMEEFTKWVQNWLSKSAKEQHRSLISFLAEMHQKFIYIHPFDDGNGRVVRLLMAYVLTRLKFLPMVLENRDLYIKAIRRADTGDNSFLEKLFLENIIVMLKHGIFSKNKKVKMDREVFDSGSVSEKKSEKKNKDAGGRLLESSVSRGSKRAEPPNSISGKSAEKTRRNNDRLQAIRRPSFREDESSQIPALQLLQNLGWTYLRPEEALNSRQNDIKNVLLEKVLESQLKKINKFQYKGANYQFKDSNITKAVDELKEIPFEGLLKTSEKVFDLLILGKSFMEDIKGDKKSYNLKYIDWENAQNNVFHVTDEYNVKTVNFDDSKRRPDIVLFINGIPVVVMECKRPDMTDPVEEAVSQHIRNQKNNEIPNLFVFSQILTALCPSNSENNKNRCLYGTTGTSMAFWHPWKEQTQYKIPLEKAINTPLSKEKKEKLFSNERYRNLRLYFEEQEKFPRQITNQDIMLYGLCRPERVMEFIKKFILYDAGKKKIARYQQYFAVKSTLKRITSAGPNTKRPSGVIWHTQGSGKSLSMVLLAKAIAMEEKIKEPKIILVTDRINLDLQIYKTFQNCQTNVTQAKSGAHLIQLLSSHKAEIIASTIFKFSAAANAKGSALDSSDIIVLVDEAHRTQYGEVHAKLKKVFPNACFIAYTGTPLTKAQRSTIAKFGSFIGEPYTSRKALDDKAIVPILYEGRVVEQRISKNILDRMFDRITKDLNSAQKADLKRKYKRCNALSTTEQRIYMVTLDISEHFSKMWKGKGFKGQLAVKSIASAFKYKKYFDEIGEISSEVIVSSIEDKHEDTQEDETALQKHERRIKENFGTRGNYEKEIIAKFNSDESPDILIVVNKLLTGFDVPRNTVLYIDKQIEEHTLLQAVARVNRIFKKKEFGYVIDYHGNFKNFLDAVAHYDALADKAQNPQFEDFDRKEIQDSIRQIKKEADKLSQYYFALQELFKDVKNKQDFSSYERKLSEKEKREEFYEKFSQFGNSLHLALSSAEFITNTPEKKIKEYKNELKSFHKLKNHIQKVYAESVDYRDYEPKIENILNNYVQAEEVKTTVPLTNIYDNKFNKEIESCKNDSSKALTIIHRTKKYISDNMEKDRVFYERLSKLLQGVLDAYRQKRIDEKDLLRRAKSFQNQALTRVDEELPPVLEGNQEAKAFFGILKQVVEKKNKLGSKEINKLADMSMVISQIIKDNIIVDWVRNMDIQNKIKNKIEDYLCEQKEQMNLNLDFSAMDKIMEEIIRTAKSYYL